MREWQPSHDNLVTAGVTEANRTGITSMSALCLWNYIFTFQRSLTAVTDNITTVDT